VHKKLMPLSAMLMRGFVTVVAERAALLKRFDLAERWVQSVFIFGQTKDSALEGMVDPAAVDARTLIFPEVKKEDLEIEADLDRAAAEGLSTLNSYKPSESEWHARHCLAVIAYYVNALDGYAEAYQWKKFAETKRALDEYYQSCVRLPNTLEAGMKAQRRLEDTLEEHVQMRRMAERDTPYGIGVQWDEKTGEFFIQVDMPCLPPELGRLILDAFELGFPLKIASPIPPSAADLKRQCADLLQQAEAVTLPQKEGDYQAEVQVLQDTITLLEVMQPDLDAHHLQAEYRQCSLELYAKMAQLCDLHRSKEESPFEALRYYFRVLELQPDHPCKKRCVELCQAFLEENKKWGYVSEEAKVRYHLPLPGNSPQFDVVSYKDHLSWSWTARPGKEASARQSFTDDAYKALEYARICLNLGKKAAAAEALAEVAGYVAAGPFFHQSTREFRRLHIGYSRLEEAGLALSPEEVLPRL
jgi:hypothetical protein